MDILCFAIPCLIGFVLVVLVVLFTLAMCKAAARPLPKPPAA